jgi:hypothetical protein
VKGGGRFSGKHPGSAWHKKGEGAIGANPRAEVSDADGIVAEEYLVFVLRT